MKQPSEIFREVFASGSGGIVRTCRCGRTYFNGAEVDYTVSTLTVSGREFVDGCCCGLAAEYEQHLIANMPRYITYWKRHVAAEQLRVEGLKKTLEGL